MMQGYAIKALAALCAVLAVIAGWQHYTGLRAELAASRAQVAAYAEAAEIRRRADEELARIERDARELDDYLSTAEGGDAPLSGYLTDAAQRVWGQ